MLIAFHNPLAKEWKVSNYFILVPSRNGWVNKLFTSGQKLVLRGITLTYLGMTAKKKIKDFKDLNQFPDLKEAVVPAIQTLPSGSINTKVIINEGEIVERVYKTPKGEIICLFANELLEEVA